MDTLGFEEYFIDDYVTDWTLRPDTTEIAQENFTFVSKYLNVITVEEKGDNIIISGINSHHFAKDVKKLWQTSRIVQYMFIKLSSREIVLPKFFAVELRYMLVKLVESGQAYSKRTIKTIIEELETKTWLKGVVSPPTEEVFNYDRLRELNVTLLPSQMEFLKLYSDIVPRYGLKGFMLATAAGGGKTEAGLALSLVSEAEVTIVIAPKNAVGEVWRERIIQRFKRTPSLATSIDKPFTGKEQYYICHYEALDRAIQFAQMNKGKKLCIILDESHNLNEIESLRTQKFINLCNMADVFSVLWASGTPLKAMGSEMVPFLSTIDPLFTQDVRARFTQIFGKSVARAVDILANRIGITSFKATKASIVELEIDERIEKVSFKGAEQFTLSKIKQEISEFVKERIIYYKENMSRYVSLYNGLIEIYRRTLRNKEDIKALDNYYRDVMHLHKRFDPMRDMDLVRACNRYEERNILPVLKGEQKVQFRDARSVVKYVQLKIRGEALGRILTKRRIECFKAMVEHTDFERIIEASEKKTLIFTSYVDVVDEIADRCFNLEYNPLKVYGDTNKDIEKIMKIYKTDSTANPMVATYDSLSTAIPVIEANTCVLFNSPFRDYERNQATSRVARLGQDSPVHIISVLLDTGSEDNISTRSNDIMEWSKQQVDAMLGYDQTVDNFDD